MNDREARESGLWLEGVDRAMTDHPGSEVRARQIGRPGQAAKVTRPIPAKKIEDGRSKQLFSTIST
jgi:hypothetical protein